MQGHRLQFRGTWTSWRNYAVRNLMRTRAKSCTCDRIAPGSNKGWGSSMWKSLAEKDWGTLMDTMLNADWQCPFAAKKANWTLLARINAVSASQNVCLFLPLWNCTWSRACSFRLLSTTKTWACWGEPSGGPEGWAGHQCPGCTKRGCLNWACSVFSTEGLGGPYCCL